MFLIVIHTGTITHYCVHNATCHPSFCSYLSDAPFPTHVLVCSNTGGSVGECRDGEHGGNMMAAMVKVAVEMTAVVKVVVVKAGW